MTSWWAASAAALIAVVLFAPVFCVTMYMDGPAGGSDTTTCTGLLPVPSNVVVMTLAAAAAFALTFRHMRRREARRP